MSFDDALLIRQPRCCRTPLMVIHLFRTWRCIHRCMLFLYSLHSCKINYLSNVLAPYEGGNKIGKVLKTSCQSPYLIFLHAMKLRTLPWWAAILRSLAVGCKWPSDAATVELPYGDPPESSSTLPTEGSE